MNDDDVFQSTCSQILFEKQINVNYKNPTNPSSLSLSAVRIYLRYGPFSSNIGIAILPLTKGTHRVLDVIQNHFYSYSSSLPQKLSGFIIKRNGKCSFCEHKIQGLTSKRDPHCAVYCLYMIYLTKVLEIDFKSAVLNLYYQTSF